MTACCCQVALHAKLTTSCTILLVAVVLIIVAVKLYVTGVVNKWMAGRHRRDHIETHACMLHCLLMCDKQAA